MTSPVLRFSCFAILVRNRYNSYYNERQQNNANDCQHFKTTNVSHNMFLVYSFTGFAIFVHNDHNTNPLQYLSLKLIIWGPNANDVTDTYTEQLT